MFNSGCSLGKKLEHPVLTTGFSCMRCRQTLKKASCAPNSACCFSSSVSWPDKSYGLSLQTLPLIHAFFLDAGSSSVGRKQKLFPCSSSTRQDLRRSDLLEEEKGSLKQFLDREVLTAGMATRFPACLCRACMRRGLSLSLVPLSQQAACSHRLHQHLSPPARVPAFVDCL